MNKLSPSARRIGRPQSSASPKPAPNAPKNGEGRAAAVPAKKVRWLPPRMDPLWDASAGVYFRWDGGFGCRSARVGVAPAVLTAAWRIDAIERKSRSVPRAWREIDWASYF